MSYYVICDANGPMSKELTTSSDLDHARAMFSAQHTIDRCREWIDDPATDLEDEIGIDASDMGYDEFKEEIAQAGAEYIGYPHENDRPLDCAKDGDWEIWEY